MMYGVDTMGVSNSMLLEQRRAAAAASQVSAAGKDLDLTLILADGRKARTDSAFLVHESHPERAGSPGSHQPQG